MRKTTLFIGIVMLFTACNQSVVTWSETEWLRYESPSYGFSFEHPPKTLVSEYEGDIYITSAPKVNEFADGYALAGTIRFVEGQTIDEYLLEYNVDPELLELVTKSSVEFTKVNAESTLPGVEEPFLCPYYLAEIDGLLLDIYGHECDNVDYVIDSFQMEN